MRYSIILAGLAGLSVAACGGDEASEAPPADPAPEAAAPEPAPETAPEPAPAPAEAAPDAPFFIDDGAFAQSGYFGGYFIPRTEVMLGPVRLEHFALGTPEELAAFAGPSGDLPYFAPFLAEFADTSSERREGEIGSYYVTSYRMLPAGYAITGDTAMFSASHEVLGDLRIEGRFTEAALAGWAEDVDWVETAFIADITIGDQVFEGVEMSFWIGD